MASSYLIGTAPDQVPSNGDLGDLAFQSKESVKFTDGDGSLSSLSMNAIYKELIASATDVFVYDTSKDSDGGAWRNRCQNLSWYNETLNTTTRGSRREFPSVAVIVLLNDTLHIYDGDSPDLPLWMTFVGHNNYSTAWAESPLGIYSRPYNAVSMLNGKLVVGMTSTVYYANNMTAIDFLMDDMRGYKYFGRYGRPISDRNIPSTGTTQWTDYGSAPYQLILGYTVNDVAMTVLPNAPIDAATGLPIPTIAVATNGGVSVIKHDGTVVNVTVSYWGPAPVGTLRVSISQDRIYHLSQLGSYWGYYLYSHQLSTLQNNVNASSQPGVLSYDETTSIPPIPLGFDNNYKGQVLFAGGTVFKFPGDTGGRYPLYGLQENTTSQSNGMTFGVSTKYNTGWMPGNIKGAWLSDTTQETVVGAELIANGTFDSNISGWTDSSGSGSNISWSAGKVYLNGTVAYALAVQGVTTVPGKTYTIAADVSSLAVGNIALIRVGTAATGSDLLNYQGTTNGTWVVQFTATTTTSYITLMTGYTCYFDNVSCRRGDYDRSVNAKGLHTYGSITKTPVATGADLVAYSGFSASNYLEQPYNSALDFGTGDFCISVWVMHPNTFNGHSHVIARINPEIANEFTIQYNETVQNLVFRCGGSEFAGMGSLSTNIWTHIVYTRRGGVLYGYMNGLLKSSSTFATNISSQNPLRVGYRSSLYAGIWTGSLALLRISATAPSVDQITKMYNDEKVLFQDNAKATLYGTSDAVTALAYDQDTKQLHVGTSSGRSVFQGLRRVDNTTTAVTTSISAVNGLVVEQ